MCVSAKNSPPRCQQLDRFKTSSVVEALEAVKDGRPDLSTLGDLSFLRAFLRLGLNAAEDQIDASGEALVKLAECFSAGGH